MTYLDHRQYSGDHDEQIRFSRESVQRSGDDAKNSVHEQAERRNAQQYIVQVALLFRSEFERLHPAIVIPHHHAHPLMVMMMKMMKPNETKA